MRRTAKIMNFGVIYGLSPYGIRQQTGFSEKEVIATMRRNLKKKSYILWRKRVRGRVTKHRKLLKLKKL